MITWSLRTKILLSVGLIILVVLGTSTLVHVQYLKRDYLEAVEWRSEALAQNILSQVLEFQTSESSQNISDPMSLRCTRLYELNKENNVTHIAVIDPSEMIAAHNNTELIGTPVESPILLNHLRDRAKTTVPDGPVYHTLVPIFREQNVYLGTIDVGFPKEAVDEKVRQLFFRSSILFGLFLLLAFFIISFLMHFLLTKPVRKLVTAGQKLATGHLVQTFQIAGRGDEITILGTVFSRIVNYLQHVTKVVSQIATGVLDGEIRIRSDHDILGKAVHEMLRYLKHVASVARKVAEGDLTETVQVRSTSDAFGRAIHEMTEGLRALIVQIRTSAEQIASTGTTISSLATNDIDVVQNVHNSVKTMSSTMEEMGTSVEEVARDMDVLSSSVEETSDSVLLITSSIAHIASNAADLTRQSHQTIESLEEAVNSLEGVVERTDVSARLSQDTIQDALEGQRAFDQVMTSMETIQQTITTAEEAITGFVRRSQDINTILDVIREITEQTSLLALNASIIAAQAGVHGRGFAVVADEIKSLAEGVGASTKDIATIVHTLQQDTNKVVQTIHEGVANVKQGIEHTQKAQDTLNKIISSARRSSSMVTEIADALHEVMTTSHNVVAAMGEVHAMTDDFTVATNEQEMSTEQINNAIVHINTMTSQVQQATTRQLAGVHQVLDAANEVATFINQNLESAQHIVHTTEKLSSQADILLRSVDRFKLG